MGKGNEGNQRQTNLCYVIDFHRGNNNVVHSIFLSFCKKKSLPQSLNGVLIPPEPLNNIK